MKSFLLWKKIITSPFQGFGELKKDTPVVLPVFILLILLAVSILILLPVIQSQAYMGAAARIQIQTMAEKGKPLSDEQQKAMADQLSSPTVKTITLISSLAGGLATFMAVTLLTALLLKLLVGAYKGSLPYGLAFRILIFAGIVTVAQGLIKNTITLTGNWEKMLVRVQDAQGLKMALESPVSLAALFSPETLGKAGYYFMNTLTDIFNWIYYLFIYASMRMTVGLEKNKALGVTLIFAACYIAVGGAMLLLI